MVDFKATTGTTTEQKKDGKKDKGKDPKDGKFKKKKKVTVTESEKGKASAVKDKPSTSKNDGCFICKGPHLARNCPKREKVNAMVAEEEGDFQTRVNPLQFLNVITSDIIPVPKDRLIYVPAKINGKEVIAMMDTGATHSCVTEREVKRLNLKLAETGMKIKDVNS